MSFIASYGYVCCLKAIFDKSSNHFQKFRTVHCVHDCDAKCPTSLRRVSPHIRYDIDAREKENVLRWLVDPAAEHCYDAVAP